MANRAHLLISPHEAIWNVDELGWIDDTRALASANWHIPALWYSLFARSDISDMRYIEGDEEVSWPYLTTSLELACQRTLDRRATFISVFPDILATLYDQWTDVIDRMAATLGGYVHLQTYDVSELYDMQIFGALLQACVRAFELNRPEDWLILCKDAGLPLEPGLPIKVTSENLPRDIGVVLCGYSVMREASWPGE
jgi:hypothetical protein